MNDRQVCDKCGREVIGEKGFAVEIIDSKNSGFFCRQCVKQALHRLSMKSNKTPDEIDLLIQIRKYLKEQIN